MGLGWTLYLNIWFWILLCWCSGITCVIMNASFDDWHIACLLWLPWLSWYYILDSYCKFYIIYRGKYVKPPNIYRWLWWPLLLILVALTPIPSFSNSFLVCFTQNTLPSLLLHHPISFNQVFTLSSLFFLFTLSSLFILSPSLMSGSQFLNGMAI